ncbi:MAG: ABC transporter ATP-binding protein [Desulfobulbaceae bacterium]|nr:ABC transporter ATP-binding protein [Desulfobulbaceae bacterium]
MTPILEVQNLSRRFGGLQAVAEVSFAVKANQIKAVIGPNGAGKTTLFNLISGAIPADSGQVIFHGQEIQGKQPWQIASAGMARTYQNIKLFPGMSALENVMVGRHCRTKAGFAAGMLNLPWTWKEEREIREKSLELLELLEIADLAGVDASSLAFGQQRAVEFARALAAEPTLLLLDEPAAGLNMHETSEVARLISKIRDRGVTVLLVEHDMSLVMDISDEIVVLCFGQKIAEGTPTAIQHNPEVIRIYLGDGDV